MSIQWTAQRWGSNLFFPLFHLFILIWDAWHRYGQHATEWSEQFAAPRLVAYEFSKMKIDWRIRNLFTKEFSLDLCWMWRLHRHTKGVFNPRKIVINKIKEKKVKEHRQSAHSSDCPRHFCHQYLILTQPRSVCDWLGHEIAGIGFDDSQSQFITFDNEGICIRSNTR